MRRWVAGASRYKNIGAEACGKARTAANFMLEKIEDVASRHQSTGKPHSFLS